MHLCSPGWLLGVERVSGSLGSPLGAMLVSVGSRCTVARLTVLRTALQAGNLRSQMTRVFDEWVEVPGGFEMWAEGTEWEEFITPKHNKSNWHECPCTFCVCDRLSSREYDRVERVLGEYYKRFEADCPFPLCDEIVKIKLGSTDG